jgi:hypothetical protein
VANPAASNPVLGAEPAKLILMGTSSKVSCPCSSSPVELGALRAHHVAARRTGAAGYPSQCVSEVA